MKKTQTVSGPPASVFTSLIRGFSALISKPQLASSTPDENLFLRINLKVKDMRKGRRITVTVPPDAFASIFNALNNEPESKQVAISGTSLLQGPANEIIRKRPFTYSYVYHWDSLNLPRDDQEAYLQKKKEHPAHPFPVAFAEGAYLAQTGKSLSEFNGIRHVVRTAKVKAKNGELIGALFSYHGRGVCNYSYFGDTATDFILVAGSRNRKKL